MLLYIILSAALFHSCHLHICIFVNLEELATGIFCILCMGLVA